MNDTLTKLLAANRDEVPELAMSMIKNECSNGYQSEYVAALALARLADFPKSKRRKIAKTLERLEAEAGLRHFWELTD